MRRALFIAVFGKIRSIALSGTTVVDNATIGTAVGTASVINGSVSGTASWSLTNSAGGKYAINSSTGAVTVNGALSAGTDLITISVSGLTPAVKNATFSIGVVSAPVNSVAPAITGTSAVGFTLSCSTGTWSNNAYNTYTYQWKMDGSNVVGATSSTYVPVSGDTGKVPTCVVTATNIAGNANATSNSASAVLGTPTNSVLPAISGSASPGQTVSVSNGTWTSSPTGYTYQWKLDGSPIGGATSSSYLVQAGDDTHTLTCTVTASNIVGSASATSAGVVVSTFPTGAVSLSYANQANTSATRKYIPNEVTKGSVAVPTFVNRKPNPDASGWTLTSVAQTTGQTDVRGGTEAIRYVGTGSWDIIDNNFLNFPAGTFTLVIVAKSNSGSVTIKQGMAFAPSSTVTITAGAYARYAVTAVKGTGLDNPIHLLTNGADCDITISDWFVYPGASDPYAGSSEGFGGHILLGASAYDQVPTVSGNVVDFSVSSTSAQMWFDSPVDVGSFTYFDCVSKVNAAAGSASDPNSIRGTAGALNYGALTVPIEIDNAPSFYLNSFSKICYRQPFSPGVATLLDLLSSGYNVIGWKYDAGTSIGTVWINDVVVASELSSRSAVAGLRALVFNIQNKQSWKWTSGASFNRALSRSECENVVSTLRAQATTDGLSLNNPQRFIFNEGDSNTDGSQGSAPGGQTYPYLYVANAAHTFYGGTFAQTGGSLSQMAARGPLLDLAIPTSKAGRKFILTGMIGTNDNVNVSAATFSTNLLSYWADRKTAGFTTVGIGLLNRTDASADPAFDTWRKAINVNLRAAVGTQLDAFVDVEADSNIGSTTAPNSTTYFIDKLHLTVGTGTTGHAALEVLYRAAVDPLL